MLFLCIHILGAMEVSKESYAVFVYIHFERNGGFKRELCRFVRIVNYAVQMKRIPVLVELTMSANSNVGKSKLKFVL